MTSEDSWIPFRDVLEVNGAPVGDHQKRLEALFLHPDSSSIDSARRITDESARYNLGTNGNVNVPLLALNFLASTNIARVAWRLGPATAIEGVPAARLDFKEVARPTLIRDPGTSGGNAPADGSFWLRAEDAAVLRTRLHVGNGQYDSDIEVDYCRTPGIDALVPCKMTERFSNGPERLTGEATYSKIRQFSVSTETRIT
jgi:hypothetical protein